MTKGTEPANLTGEAKNTGIPEKRPTGFTTGNTIKSSIGITITEIIIIGITVGKGIAGTSIVGGITTILTILTPTDFTIITTTMRDGAM